MDIITDNSDYIPENDSNSESDDTSTENKSMIHFIKNRINVDCNEDDFVEIINDMFDCIDEYINQEILRTSFPDFYKSLVSDIANLFYDYWIESNLCIEDDYDDIEELVESVFDLYMDFYHFTPRSIKYDSLKQLSFITNDEMNILHAKINRLKQIPQPTQRTKEWYEFRYNLITASNIWKALSSQANQNSLIYEKCKPLNTNNIMGTHTNTTSTLHWGVRYEPVSILVYEDMFQTRIGDFGCIPHSTHSFIGASPDGINIDETNLIRYGRMLEIKNIYNRDITGIPKEEYWIQTQVQMETCDLDQCDFFETRFKEFESKDAFYQDEVNDYKGVILYFIQKTSGFGIDISNTNIYNNKPHYIYMPLSVEKTEYSIQNWINSVRDELKNEYTLYSTIYWYLHEYSCVLIPRNRQWFDAALPKLREIWNTIVKERVDGYEHRAAKKQKPRQKDTNQLVTVENNSETNTQIIRNMPTKKPVCLVKLDS